MKATIFHDDVSVTPSTRFVLIRGKSTQPIDYIFIDDAISIIISAPAQRSHGAAAAMPLIRALLHAVDKAADAMDAPTLEPVQDDEPVTPAARRVASWFAGLTSWRGAVRQWMGIMTAEQRAFVQEWAIGMKAAVSSSAGALARRMHDASATPREQDSARRSLADRGKAAWSVLREKVALSAVATKAAATRAATEAKVVASFEATEQRELERLRVSRQAESNSDSDSDDDDDDDDDDDELRISKVERTAIHRAASLAAAKTRKELAAEALRSQILEESQLVHAAVEGVAPTAAVALFGNSELLSRVGLGADADPDEIALLAEMFRPRPDMLVRLQHLVAREEAEHAVAYELRQRYEPLAIAATAQTQMAAGFGPRFTATTLRKFWAAPASVYGLRSPFADERQIDALFRQAAAKWDVQFTPSEAPDGSSLQWKSLLPAGAAYDVLQVLQLFVDIQTVAACIDIDDSNLDDIIYLCVGVDGRRDGKRSRCLWTIKIVNLQNVALAVTSALTIALSDGDDHAGALPHAWRLMEFISGVKAGALRLNVRGKPRKMAIYFDTDSVALYEQTYHSSALATYPFPQCGATKDVKNDLMLLLAVTHTARTQKEMWALTHKVYMDKNEGKTPPKSAVDTWARLYDGIKDHNYYDLDMRYFFKGGLHIVMRFLETMLVLFSMYFHASGRLVQLNDLWRSLGLKTFVFELEGKLYITMRGNDMREALKLGPKLFDPELSNIEYDGESWIQPDVVELFAEAMSCFQRVDVTLRGVAFGNGKGSIPHTFTWGLQTYIYDTNYLCEIVLLLGNLTMTHRSTRDLVPCFLVQAVRSGFAYALFGEDNNEARHHDQHLLTRLVTGGGRGGATKREREELALQKITRMEKLSDSWGETVMSETLCRHLGTMKQQEVIGTGAFARFPTWRHPGGGGPNLVPKFALFGALPAELQSAIDGPKKKKAEEPEATASPSKRPRTSTSSPGGAGSSSADQPPMHSPATRPAPSTPLSGRSGAGHEMEVDGGESEEASNYSRSVGGGTSQQQPNDGGEGEGEEHAAEEQDSGGGEAGAEEAGEEEELQPEDEEAEEESMREHVAELLEEQGSQEQAIGGEGGSSSGADGGGSSANGSGDGAGGGGAAANQPKLPTIELRGLRRVTIGHSAYEVGGKRELKLVGPHGKLKMQADLDSLGLHRLHVSFASIFGMGKPPMPAASGGMQRVSFNLCAAPELHVWDTTKTVTGKGKPSKGDWVATKGFGVMTQVIFELPKEAAKQLWETLGQDTIFAGYQSAPSTDIPEDFDPAMHAANEKQRSTAPEMLLLTDYPTAIKRGRAALEALRNQTAMGKAEERKCQCCEKPWWVELVHIKVDRTKPFVPTSEMCVACEDDTTVSVPLQVVSAGDGGSVELHVECKEQRFTTPRDRPAHVPAPAPAPTQQRKAPATARATADTMDYRPSGDVPAATKVSEPCPLCSKSYNQLKGGGHSKAFVDHVHNNKGGACNGIGRLWMDEAELAAAAARGDDATAAKAKAAFKRAADRGFCTCAECQRVFGPHATRLSA